MAQQNIRSDFPHLNISILKKHAKRWADIYSESRIKRIVLYKYAPYENQKYMHGAIDTRYAVFFEIPYEELNSELTETEMVTAHLNQIEGKENPPYAELLSDIEYLSTIKKDYFALLTADFDEVYKEKPHPDFKQEWIFEPCFINAVLPKAVLQDTATVLYDWIGAIASRAKHNGFISVIDLIYVMAEEERYINVIPELWSVFDMAKAKNNRINRNISGYDLEIKSKRVAAWVYLWHRMANTETGNFLFKNLPYLKPIPLYSKEREKPIKFDAINGRQEDCLVKLNDIADFFQNTGEAYQLKIPLPELLFPESRKKEESRIDLYDRQEKGVGKSDLSKVFDLAESKHIAYTWGHIVYPLISKITLYRGAYPIYDYVLVAETIKTLDDLKNSSEEYLSDVFSEYDLDAIYPKQTYHKLLKTICKKFSHDWNYGTEIYRKAMPELTNILRASPIAKDIKCFYKHPENSHNKDKWSFFSIEPDEKLPCIVMPDICEVLYVKKVQSPLVTKERDNPLTTSKEEQIKDFKFKYESDIDVLIQTPGKPAKPWNHNVLGFARSDTKEFKELLEVLENAPHRFCVGTANSKDGRNKEYDARMKLLGAINKKLYKFFNKEFTLNLPADYKLYELDPTEKSGTYKFKFQIGSPLNINDEHFKYYKDWPKDKIKDKFLELCDDHQKTKNKSLYEKIKTLGLLAKERGCLTDKEIKDAIGTS